jgi:dTDP-4-amino-4,6-dideoxygalactose transaminase
MNWKIPLFDLDYGPEEEQAVLDVLRSRWLTMGEVTARFEAAFAESCGVKHAVAVANGTVALHLACLGADIGPGDEVIVPALTFVATAACVRYVGATPVFADVTSPDDLTLSPQSVEALITPRTRAIIVMHYGGYVCDMPAFRALAEKHNLKLIEDACHAPGAERDGRRAGAWGDVAAFSFFSNKNLATGEGGMLTTDDDEIAAKLRRLRSHGMTSLTWDRHRGHAWSYDVTDLGYNYRPSEMLAALGLAQLSKLEASNQRRRELTARVSRVIGRVDSASWSSVCGKTGRGGLSYPSGFAAGRHASPGFYGCDENAGNSNQHSLPSHSRV